MHTPEYINTISLCVQPTGEKPVFLFLILSNIGNIFHLAATADPQINCCVCVCVWYFLYNKEYKEYHHSPTVGPLYTKGKWPLPTCVRVCVHISVSVCFYVCKCMGVYPSTFKIPTSWPKWLNLIHEVYSCVFFCVSLCVCLCVCLRVCEVCDIHPKFTPQPNHTRETWILERHHLGSACVYVFV